jgi:hypothetical protein
VDAMVKGRIRRREERISRSAAADEGHDLDRVALAKLAGGVVATGHEAAVDFDGAGTGGEPAGAELREEFVHRRLPFKIPNFAVQCDPHATQCRVARTLWQMAPIDAPSPPGRTGGPRFPQAILLCLLAALGLFGCSDPRYDTSTPEKTLDAMALMIADGRPDLLPTLLEVKPREIRFDDGVTEASAIGDVKGKLGDMLGRLWRVSQKLKSRWPDQVAKEIEVAKSVIAQRAAGTPISRDIGDILSRIMADPFVYLTSMRERLHAVDMTDGTASLEWDGEPWQGPVLLIETDDGWRISIPEAYVQGNDVWPQTRQEWAVVAAMMLGIENSLKDFEREIDSGKFRDLRQASERVGRLIGESVVAQAIIYATMKPKADTGSSGEPLPAGATE